jgi:hypothetical protein
MEVLGRNANIIPVAANQSFKMRGASSAMIVCSTSSLASTGNTFTVNEASSFTGGLTAVNVIKNVYWSTGLVGATAWQKQTYNPAVAPYLTGGPGGGPGALSAIQLATASTNAPVTATLAVFHVFTSQLSDPNSYIQITVTGSSTGLVTVILSDLTPQRAPANLEILAS